VKGFAKAFALIGGPIGIILFILPEIIANWDKIVAFFKDLIPKLGKIFSDMWSGLTSFLGDAWTGITTWFTGTFLPGLGDFFMKALEIIGFILFPLPSLIIKFWPEITAFFTNVVFPWFTALPGKIMEFAGKIWNFLKDAAVIAWDALVKWFTIVFTFYRELPGRILNLAGKVWEFLSTGVQTAWKAVTGYITNTLIPWVTGLPGRVAKVAGKIWEFISGGIRTAWTTVTGYITNTLIPGVLGLPARMTRALSGLWSGLLGGIQAAWNGVKQWWNTNVASKKLVIGGFKVLGVQIPKVELGFPRLAKGGIIPASPGGTMAVIGEAGRAERVEPLDPNGLSNRDKAMIDYMSGGMGNGATINVYPSAGMDERELADLVSRKLAQSMRRGAA
jgi:phage-related protein